MKVSRPERIKLKRDKNGVSPAISTVIMTAATVVLVLVASQYAYRIMEQNKGAAEFATAKKAMLTLDDSIEYVADKPQTSRSTQFTANYGRIELIPNALNLTMTVNVANNSTSYSTTFGLIKYSISTAYVNYGGDYREYILGDEKVIVTRGTEDLGQIVVEQKSGLVSVILSYRVYAAKTYETVSLGQNVTYVDVRIIKIEVQRASAYAGELDIIARCVDRSAIFSHVFDVPSDGITATVSAKIGESPMDSWTSAPLRKGIVVFNFIVSVVSISVYGGR
ncbi:MAG: hypothetical protein QW468_02890 [Candidatus Bathyarchaeia archaeon]